MYAGFLSSLNFIKLQLLAGKQKKGQNCHLFFFFIIKFNSYNEKDGLFRMFWLKAPEMLIELQNF